MMALYIWQCYIHWNMLTLRDSSVGPTLDLFPNDYQFDSPQGHWRLTWSLTLGSRGISRGTRKLARTSTNIKKKTNKQTNKQTVEYVI